MKFFLITCALSVPLTASAEIILYDPSPYLGSFDSPFYAGIQAGTIYLEDFEDGQLNTPGVFVGDFTTAPTAFGWIGGTVKSFNPATIAMSVDEDDGLNGDFIGSGGDSWTNIQAPGRISRTDLHGFAFLPDVNGRYPLFVGFVVTRPRDFDEDVIVTIDGPNFEEIRDEDEFDPDLWDPAFVGDTRSHRFIGAYSSTGIRYLRIEGVSQLDHLQFGYAIPEPSCGLLVVFEAALLLRRSRVLFPGSTDC